MKNIARIPMLLAAALCVAARRREVRPAGARTPAPSTSAGPRRLDARTGRARARLLSLLPVFALLLGALSPFAADPAAAQVTSPSVPRNVSVTADDGQLILNWQAPSSWGTWSAFGYRVEWKLSTAQATAWAPVQDSGTIREPVHSDTQLTFTGLQSDAGGSSHTVTNGTSYDLRIQAFSKGPGQSDVRASSWVTVTNKAPAARSTDADLTGLTASSSTSASGTFTALTLTPRFLAATTSYMATVANTITHVKLTPTQKDKGDFAHILVGIAGEAPTALVSTDGVASGSASPAIALSVGANVIPVRVVADDLISMMDYTVTITRLEPGTSPPAPTLVPGDQRLTASWSTPGNSYELQYKESDAPDQEDRLTGADPARGWIDYEHRLAPHSYVLDIRKKSAVIRGPYLRDKPKGLKRGTSYDVRLRVMTSGVAGQWSAVARATTLGTKPEPETTAEPTGPHPVGPSRLGSFGEQTLLTATLTVGGTGRFFGCDNTYAPVPNCSAALTTNSFTHEGTANTLERLYIDTDDANVELSLEYGTAIRQATGHWRRLTLYVDGKSFPLAKGNYLTNLATEWTNTGLTWSAGQRVQVRLTATPWTGVEFESTSFVPSSETGRNDLIVPEGGSATFGVKLSRAPSANVTVNLVKSVLQGASGDANAATVSPATLTFTSTNWSQAQTVTVTGVQDSDGDHEHLMILALVSSTDTDYGSADGTEGVFVTVSDDGGAVQVGAWPAAGREDDNNFLSGHDITFWLSRSSTSPVSVYYTSEEGTATLDADYSMAPSTVTFAPGETRKQVQFYVLDDDVEDSGETFYVVLSNPSGATIAPGYGRAVVEILNDEAHLDGLSVEGAPGAGGPWAKLDLGAFAAETTAYAVTVPHGTTHARLVPATADEDLTLRAGSGTALTRVRSGGSGPAVALAVGANVLVVKTTAGTGVEKTYEVTVTRQAAQQQQAQQQQQQRTEPLTAAFENVPSEHDGTAFTFDLTLSEAPGAGNLPVAASFKVAPGKASVSGSGTRYTVTVTPKKANAWKDVTITLLQPADCAVSGAICTADGRALSNSASATIGGPVRIRIEGARAKEGKDESLDFAVTLNRAAAHDVSVDYATEDGTATAGADYTATSGTLTFAAGETAKTVSVPVLDDAIDEGKETMRLLLSNPRGAYLRNVHSKAKGVIRNEDPLQAMWLARFGRAAAGHVAEAIDGRLSGGAAAGVVLGGHSLTGKAEREAIESRLAEALLKEREVRLGRGGEAQAPSVREVAMSDLLLASSFHMASAGGGDAGSRWSLWGRGARSSFEGAEGDLSLEGDVTTATVGFDYERARWLVGVALSRSSGDGSYKAGGACDTGCAGEVESALTGVYPYARYRVSGTFSLWGAVGHGQGEMTLTPGGSSPVEADVAMGMAAAGARGVVLPAREAGGFELALRADVLVTNTRSDAAAGLAETEAETSRVRLVLEGSRSLRFGDAVLTPSLEIGFRNDSGDAETGGGVEAGGSVRWASGALTTELRARSLLSHGESGYEEWGVSASVAYAPGSGGRGLTLRAGSSWGASTGGAERLWSQAAGLSPGGAFEPGAAGFEAEAAWGLDAPRGLLTPYTGVAVTGSGETWRAGARWKPGAATEVSLEASLTEQAGGGRPEGGLLLKGSKRW